MKALRAFQREGVFVVDNLKRWCATHQSNDVEAEGNIAHLLLAHIGSCSKGEVFALVTIYRCGWIAPFIGSAGFDFHKNKFAPVVCHDV